MFTTKQIISATQMIKNFPRTARRIRENREALLISQKGGKYLVLADADMFQNLVRFEYEARAAGFTDVVERGDDMCD